MEANYAFQALNTFAEPGRDATNQDPEKACGPEAVRGIQPRRAVCLTAFLALICFAIFALNTVTNLLLKLTENEELLTRISAVFASHENPSGT